jgi:hypothetical protein
MSQSEKKGRTLPIRSAELKSEIAANTGLNTNILAQRINGFGKLAEGMGFEHTVRRACDKLTRRAKFPFRRRANHF